MGRATEEVLVRFRQQGAEGVAKSTESIGKSASAAASALRIMRNFLVIASAFRAVSGFVAMTDALDNLGDRIKFAANAGGGFNSSMAHVGDLARDVREPLEGVGEAYARVAELGGKYGLVQTQIDSATTNTIKLFKLYGGSAQDAADFLGNFLTRLEGGQVTQRVWLGLMRDSPPAAAALAASLGQTTQSMGAFIKESGGALDVKRILDALANGSEALDAQWTAQSKTFGEAITNISNGFKLWLADFQETSFIANTFFAICDVFANNTALIMTVAITGIAFALVLLGQQALAAGQKITAMFLGNPLGLWIAGLTLIIQLFAGTAVSIDGNITGMTLLTELWNMLGGWIKTAYDWVMSFFPETTSGAADAGDELTVFGTILAVIVNTFETLYEVGKVAVLGITVGLLKLNSIFDRTESSAAALALAQEDLAKATNDLATRNQILDKAMQNVKKDTDSAAGSARTYNAALDAMDDKAGSAANSVSNLGSSTTSANSALSAGVNGANSYANALSKVADAAQSAGDSAGYAAANFQNLSTVSNPVAISTVGTSNYHGSTGTLGGVLGPSKAEIEAAKQAEIQKYMTLSSGYAGLGDFDKALKYLKKAYEAGGFNGDSDLYKLAKLQLEEQRQTAANTAAMSGSLDSYLSEMQRLDLARRNVAPMYKGPFSETLGYAPGQLPTSSGSGGIPMNHLPVVGSGWPSLGMASGGSFQMPGNFGGKDSIMAALRLAPGEEVEVRRPRDQTRDGLQRAGDNINITFNVQTPDADSFRKNRAQIQGELLAAVRQAERHKTGRSA